MESIYETMHGNRGNKDREEDSGKSQTNKHSQTLTNTT